MTSWLDNAVQGTQSFLTSAFNSLTQAVTTPGYAFGGLPNIGETIGKTTASAIGPLLPIILLIVFIFAVGGGRIA